MNFAKGVLGTDVPFPVSLDQLQVASTFFRNQGTFGNYCGHWQTTSELLQVSTAAFSTRALKRAKLAIGKRHPREPIVQTFL